ncbi:MAG: NAD-dependent epimerase/dehydratase family protein, partial [Deltaproteobacteria bacterium]
ASCALRLFNVYGPRQRADSAYAAAVPIFMERGLKGEPLTIFGDGHQTRDFVFVNDVADAVFRAATSENCGVFNVGTASETRVLELADTIVRITGGVGEHDFQPSRKGDARATYADIASIRQALGWSPAHTLEQGLTATLAWYREKLGIR